MIQNRKMVGKAIRVTEGVDLATTSTGYYVGWTEIDEWLRFTVDVEKEGDYDVIFQTAGGSGSIELNFSNGDKAYTATYSHTPDWNIWTTNVRTNIHLLPGIQYLTVNMNNKQFNLDYIEIVEHQTENLQVPENLRVDTMWRAVSYGMQETCCWWLPLPLLAYRWPFPLEGA